MSIYLHDGSFAKLAVKDWIDWIDLFNEFTKSNKNTRTLIIIAEFPVLIETIRAVPSISKKSDQNFKNTSTMLIPLAHPSQ